MPASFAALEARVNAAVIDRLSNRVATCVPRGGGVAREIAGIYDAEYATQLDDMTAGSMPAFTCRSAEVPGLTSGATLTLQSVTEMLPDGSEVVWASVTFTVVEIQPDGAGMSVLRLRKAS